MQIHLLSGPVQSGKTTYLLNYTEQNKNCSGILSPVIDGLRYFYDIESKEKTAMEADEFEREIFKIGRYTFSKNAFQWAEQKINSSITKPTPVLLLDEIGPLELKGEGFSKLIFQLVQEKSKIENLVLVVRATAVVEVCRYFKLDKTKIKPFYYLPFSKL